MAETTQRNELEDIITAIIGGGMKGYSSGRSSELELRKEIWKEKLKRQLNPEESELKSAQAEYYRAGAGQRREMGNTMPIITGYDEEGNPQINYMPKGTKEILNPAQKDEILSPSEKRQKLIDTRNLFSTVKTNEVKRKSIKEAENAIKNIPQGLSGKINIWSLKRFDPQNPILEDWQKVKMVLTDAQLLNTAKTKGAISDKEMELFAEAAANDDLSSSSRIKPIFKKLVDFMNAEEEAQKEAYYVNYGKGKKSLIPKTKTENLIEVTNPNGKKVKIKSSQLEQALQKGYKR